MKIIFHVVMNNSYEIIDCDMNQSLVANLYYALNFKYKHNYKFTRFFLLDSLKDVNPYTNIKELNLEKYEIICAI